MRVNKWFDTKNAFTTPKVHPPIYGWKSPQFATMEVKPQQATINFLKNTHCQIQKMTLNIKSSIFSAQKCQIVLLWDVNLNTEIKMLFTTGI